ncbi:MAG: LacI family DNA-binding transcriptional regulator [Rhodospirillales bacterium]
MATIKEVAKRARVSVGTVSNVMSGAVSVSPALRERVERAARELSYQPNHIARSLKSRRTQTLGMVISDITNPFFPLMVRGAEDAAVKRGYLLNIFNTDDHVEREKTVFATLRVRRVDGVLAVVAPHSTRPTHLQQMIEAGIPLVCLDRLPPGMQVDAVVVDNAKGAAMCVRHLLSMGHRLIGVISGSSMLQTARERVNGYRKALAEAGIPFNPELLREGDFRLESGYRLAKDLCLGNPRPTVLFVANGLMGMGAIKAIQEMGLRCPEDVAIAVFDDVPGGDIFRPQLTVVSQPAYEIGYRGAELLIQRITGEIKSSKPVTVVLEPELKVRESTLGVRYAAQPVPNPVAPL